MDTLQDWQFEVVQPITQQVVETPEETGCYLVMFTASWCSPCQSWKKTNKSKIVAAGHGVTEVDCSNGNSWGVSSLPSFWIVDRKTKKPIKKYVGTVSADTLLSHLNPIKFENYSVYNGKPGSSHQNRQALINHLMNQGIHRNKHLLSDLNRMTDVELDKLHNSDHN
jgi:hypothetical protein